MRTPQLKSEGGKARRPRLRRGAPAAACLALLGSLTLWQGGASAQQGGPKNCVNDANPPCVMMIQIDGLEATDVTPDNTPVLWSLAHPDGDGDDDGTPEVPPASGTPLGAGRNGWIWQAPRASMSAGLAANAASFLIGGYAEQTGIPSDELFIESERARLGGADTPADTETQEIGSGDLGGASVLRLVKEQFGDPADGDAETAAFIGDPNLGKMIVGDQADSDEVDHGWYPTPQGPGAPAPQNPALCDIPRDPFSAPVGVDGQHRACAADDAQTLAQAFQDLNANPNVLLSYIELAELGRVKRASSQVDSPGAITSALHDMDAALGAFLNAYANPANAVTSAKWPNTVVMITGTSGYEQTLPTMRVPDPDDEGQDLAHHVAEFSQNNLELVSQGTVATVYPVGNFGQGDSPDAPSPEHRQAVQALKAELETNQGNACGAEGCIAEVLYTRPELTPDGTAAGTVAEAHPDWHLDHKNVPQTEPRTATPSGRSGDLLVVMNPGWGAGKAVPAESDLDLTDTTNLLTNPYPASTGGPRNRAVAAIINGFGGAGGVRPLRGSAPGSSFDRYPVAGEAQGTADEPVCDAPPLPGGPLSLGDANATPEDDANAIGHECQAEVLDFAPTAAALLRIAMPADQICGRLLNEAFNSPLTPQQDQDEAPVAFFTAGPVTPPEGQEFPQSDKNVSFEFDVEPDTRTVIDCGEETVIENTAECKLDSAEYAACTSPAQIGPLAKGIHEYCVRAVSGDLISAEPECAKFEVVDFFDFDGLLRDLRAKVTDFQGNTFARAPRKRVLNRIQISADYGRPLSAVTLTLYRQSRGKKLCGSGVFRPKAAVAAKGSRKAAARSVSASKAAGCPLTGLARFKPFKIDRGHVDLRLRIPRDYRPTHVGVTVQQILLKPLTAAQQAACKKSQSLFCLYQPTGTAEGGIVRIAGARKLHATKGKAKKKKKGKNRKRGKGKKKGKKKGKRHK